jgi:ribosomal protein L32E
MRTFRFPYLPVREVVLAQDMHFRSPKRIRALASSGLHRVVAGSLSSVDVKNLAGHKTGAIEVEHCVYNIGHISHPAH